MQEVFDFLEKEIKLKKGDIIVIGNSGGPDSMALLNVILTFRKKLDLKVICAHVNHNVRKVSFKEKEFLEKYCLDHDVVFESMVIEKYGDDNFHNEARNIRYNYFEDIVRKYGANYLMTAHHGDDLIETIVMRIVRGSTLKGYSGFSRIVEKDSYKIVRPLIFVTKNDILTYDSKENIPYVIDKSNFKGKYTRNRYRKTLLPFLKSEDKNVHKKFLKFNKTLEDYDRYINSEIDKVLKKVYKNKKVDLNKYNELDPLIQRKLIYKILEETYRDDLMIINDSHVGLIKKLIKSRKANAYVCLPDNVRVVKSYDTLEIGRDEKEVTSYEIELLDYAFLPNGHTIEKVDDDSIGNGNDVCRISNKDITYPLYVRTRKYGDKMELKTVGGHKKVKDIFIDSKIPKEERDKWPVVVDSTDKIIWIPNLKKSKFTKQKKDKYDIILKYE